MKEYHVLNLGAGVQSTTLYLMGMRGELEIPPFDCAIFADPQDEPQEVYPHVEWLKSLGGPPIHVRTAGRLGDDLMQGRNSTGQRFAPIPAFTAIREGEPLGMVQRQCTKEYKIEVIERYIRRELLKLEPKQHVPKDVVIHQYVGFSFDEAGRAARMKGRFAGRRGWEVHFPLFDELMKRADCERWLQQHGNVPHEVPRSACVYCPFRSNREWRRLRNNPADWARAVEVDNALRIEGNIVNRNLDQALYVHKSCVPLERANLDDDQRTLAFAAECEGGCWT